MAPLKGYNPTHFLATSPAPYVAHIEINRPEKLNSFHEPMWLELRTLFTQLSSDPDIRAIILSGAGPRAFSAGLDVLAASSPDSVLQVRRPDAARRAAPIRRHIAEFQDCVSAVERCEKPVVAVLHGVCYGLAVDIACAADVRIASADAKMAVREVDIGLAADVGSLSRLPRVVGSLGWVKEVALTGREFGAAEAAGVGFVARVEGDKGAAVAEAVRLAGVIAAKSPVAVVGTKEILNHARDHTVEDSRSLCFFVYPLWLVLTNGL
jgi:delta(3,5)-delta(2,4)-dienoyl-CoA isomerase